MTPGAVAARSVGRTTGLAVVGLLLSVSAMLATAAPATAHAALVSMSPAIGGNVAQAPARVTLAFDENVRSPSKIIVTGPSGRVDQGATEVVDNTVSVAVTIRARPADVGAYRVAYRVVSADGHPVSAEEGFRFAPPGVQADPQPRSGPESGPDPGSSSRTWWWVGATALVVGLSLVLLLPRRRPGRSA